MIVDVKQAIATAKQHAGEIFADEGLTDPTLEEVWFDHSTGEWFVTVGFRPGSVVRMPKQFRYVGNRVIYKIVCIDGETGEPKSIKVREPST